VSGPLRLFHRIFRPAIWMLQGTANFFLKHVFRIAPVGEHELAHSSEELRFLLGAAAQAKELTHRGADISQRALGLDSLVVRDVLTPRREVVFLDVELSLAENLRRAKASRHTRFPLCREHLDTSLGLIHIKDLMTLEGEAQPDLSALARELITVPEMMSLERVLEVFLKNRAHLALALDEYGGAAGIVTLDNVIEELVGEIQDEFDAEQPAVERTGADTFVAQGWANLREIREMTGLELESEEVSTFGGYVTEQLGRLPHPGETLELSGYLATVVKADKRHVRQITLQKLGAPTSRG
jgi:CBS domain containing-hemolysin-like protein